MLLILDVLNVCIVTNAYQRNRVTKRIASNRNIITRRKRSLQSTYTLTSKITATNNAAAGNSFGDENGALAISNNRIIVGAFGHNAAYLFMDPNDPESGHSYSQMAILTSSDWETNDQFGRAVDIDGDNIVVGDPNLHYVYVFRILNDNNNISQMAKISAQNGVTVADFGCSVAIHANFILVGACFADANGFVQVGSAYLFVNPSNDPNNQEWTQIMQFQPNDLAEYDWFGESVAMDDQIAVVGSDGHGAYVFVPVDGSIASLALWTQMAKLIGREDSTFGNSVAVAGNSIVVSADTDDNINGYSAGAIFVFTKLSSSTWTQTNILLASDGADFDHFGWSVAISKDASTIVVGAIFDDYDLTIEGSGSMYLFRNSNTTTTTTIGWSEVGKYVAADRGRLGTAIAVENSIAVVSDSDAGCAYILDTENPPTPTTTTPIVATTAPTTQPTVPSMQPSPSPTSKLTNAPIFIRPATMDPSPNTGNDNNSNNNPSSPPATSIPTTGVPATPMPPNNNSTSSSSSPNDSTTKSNNNYNNIIIATVVVFGVVVIALGFFYYQLRVKRLEQQQQTMPPSSAVMADVIFPIQSTQDRTMEADVLVDLPPTPATPAARAVGNIDTTDAEKGFPRYKDQVQTIGPPGPSHIPSSEPMKNHQKNWDPEELPRIGKEQQQQQRCDPPATVNLLHGRFPTFKEQLSI